MPLAHPESLPPPPIPPSDRRDAHGAADRLSALLKLAFVAERRDLDTASHMMRVGQFSGLLASRLTGDEAFADLVCRAAPFHDIGKVCIADAILKKPGPLDGAEWHEMRRHPEFGAHLLDLPGDPLFDIAADVARGHHERFDGTGYPRGLAGAAIPLSARITAVADYYDALTTDRCYRPAQPEEQVLDALRAGAGAHFDPLVVAALSTHVALLRELRDEVNAHALARRGQGLDEQALAPLY